MINKINISLLKNNSHPYSDHQNTHQSHSRVSNRLRMGSRPKKTHQDDRNEINHAQTQQELHSFDDKLHFFQLQRPSTSGESFKGKYKKSVSQVINVKSHPQKKWSEQDEADKFGGSFRGWEQSITQNLPLSKQKQDQFRKYPHIPQKELVEMSKMANGYMGRGRVSKFLNSFRQKMFECPQESNRVRSGQGPQFSMRVIGLVSHDEHDIAQTKEVKNIQIAGNQYHFFSAKNSQISLSKKQLQPKAKGNPNSNNSLLHSNKIYNQDNNMRMIPRENELYSQRQNPPLQSDICHTRRKASQHHNISIGVTDAPMQYSIIKPCEIKAVTFASRNEMRETYQKRRRDQRNQYMEILNKIKKRPGAVQSDYDKASKARICRLTGQIAQSQRDRLAVEPWQIDVSHQQLMMIGQLI